MLITIEGTDGSGKGTQAKLLVKHLQAEGKEVIHLEFPQYTSSFFGREVGKYLNGDYGTLDQIHPKLASLLFAGDRFQAKPLIEQALNSGKIVVCDRYVESNIAYQSCRVKEEERHDLINWLEQLEYGTYELPVPTRTIFLDVPLDVSIQLVMLKNKRDYTDKKEDIHEGDYSYLEVVYKTYKHLAIKNSWKTINCMSHPNIKSVDTLRTIEHISVELCNYVDNLIEEQDGNEW